MQARVGTPLARRRRAVAETAWTGRPPASPRSRPRAGRRALSRRRGGAGQRGRDPAGLRPARRARPRPLRRPPGRADGIGGEDVQLRRRLQDKAQSVSRWREQEGEAVRPEVLTEPGPEANVGLSAPGRRCSAVLCGASSRRVRLPCGPDRSGGGSGGALWSRGLSGWVIHCDLAALAQGPQF